jgi:hypothetical protein
VAVIVNIVAVVQKKCTTGAGPLAVFPLCLALETSSNQKPLNQLEASCIVIVRPPAGPV